MANTRDLAELVLNLGCPIGHAGQTCVDRNPRKTEWYEPTVIKADVYQYLLTTEKRYTLIRTKNLLEHLPNVALFLSGCYEILSIGGRLEIITDNAEFLPFYLPFWIRHTGIGAHARNEYAIDHCDSIHYSIFTKMHLRNLLEYAQFKDVRAKRIWGGARLYVEGTKP